MADRNVPAAVGGRRIRGNPRLVKMYRTYTVEEVARLFDKHRNTVRSWVKEGLPTLDSGKPMLIMGSALITFLRARRERNRRPCGPGRLYCMRCREPRVPAGSMADYQQITTTVGNLVGLCPVCEGLMNRRVNNRKLADVASGLDVRLAKAEEDIR
ncbi:MAG: helix-turn-helix domain-containing protein [Burkholderiales bacterium]